MCVPTGQTQGEKHASSKQAQVLFKDMGKCPAGQSGRDTIKKKKRTGGQMNSRHRRSEKGYEGGDDIKDKVPMQQYFRTSP